MILKQSEIVQAQEIIDLASPGNYKLKELYGSKWSTVESPTSFGAKFKETVQAGYLHKIWHDLIDSDNSNVYTVKK